MKMATSPVVAPRKKNGPSPWAYAQSALEMITGPWTAANARSWAKLIGALLIVNWLFVQLYRIPSGSMEPTLIGDPHILYGDRVAVNKAAFGPRIPFTTIRLFKLGGPNRWDIVVLRSPDPNAINPVLIKRVVGLPGERVHIADGQLFVNGSPVEVPERLKPILYYTTNLSAPKDWATSALLYHAKEGRIPEGVNPDSPGAKRLVEEMALVHDRVAKINDVETLPADERDRLAAKFSHSSRLLMGSWVAEKANLRPPDDTRLIYGINEEDKYALIPEDHYLVLGDNSGNSVDGRVYGWVPHSNLYGRAFGIGFPIGHMADLSGFTKLWWGYPVLFGIPLLLVLWELRRSFVVFSWRMHEASAALGLRKGDRVRISRIAFGLRVPFLRGIVLLKRVPRPDEVVAYLGADDHGHSTLNFGVLVDPATVVRKKKGDSKDNLHYVKNPDAADGLAVEVSGDDLVGRVSAVVWPLGRRRRLELPPAPGETAPA